MMMRKLFTPNLLSEDDMKQVIGKTLRFGTFASCAITLLGGAIYLFRSDVIPDYSPEHFSGTDSYLRGISGILPRIMEADGAAIIQLGVIVLIATPVVRVLFSAIAFLLEKDGLYVGITLLVLFLIVANMIFGLH
jgi:uncharacterized membrane protein